MNVTQAIGETPVRIPVTQIVTLHRVTGTVVNVLGVVLATLVITVQKGAPYIV